MRPTNLLHQLEPELKKTSSFIEVLHKLRSGEKHLQLSGLPNALGAFLLSYLKNSIDSCILIITSEVDTAEKWRDDLRTILGHQAVSYFPSWNTSLYENTTPDLDSTALRIETVARLARGEKPIVVAPAIALSIPLIPPHALELGTLSLKVGCEYDIETLITHLVDCGFERVSTIDEVGQFSLRGGILDVYPYATEYPFRVEFFDDEIESIRHFDVGSQRSRDRCEQITIPPAREIILCSPFYEDFQQKLKSQNFDEQIVKPLIDQFEMGDTLEGLEPIMAVLYGSDSGLFEYLSEPILFTDQNSEIKTAIDSYIDSVEHEFSRKVLPVFSPSQLLRPSFWLEEEINKYTRLVQVSSRKTKHSIQFGASKVAHYDGEIKVLQREIERLFNNNYLVHINSETQGQNNRLKEIFLDFPEIHFNLGTLHEGFYFPQSRIAFINDHELFSRTKRRFRYQRFRNAKKIKNYTSLTRGDYVVHIDHGIGRFSGIQHLNVEGREYDCLAVTYIGEDRLLIPIDQLDRLRKYSNSEDDTPVLSKLGGTAWEKLKERTKVEIFEMASELVQLYAERKALSGFQFSPDGIEQQKLEAAFPFQETIDQLRTVEEVKADMESDHPMDRLVCGDVGYGKTEIAVRAAFKAISDNKQVAVLVPTTILAEQHLQTFSERMSKTGARIEVLSRFRNTKEQTEVIEATKNGHVDILIGTHRILSKDVRFRDLGLLIVDEEQRFGVGHKEKLKQLKRLVDVLTLTATPIPRTLHMSLMGSRDMSIINTPPNDRIPIQTEIMAFDEERIAEAIQREIERGGQIYFVHNRIEPLINLESTLNNLLPHVRFVTAHGQMPGSKLEKIMMDFMNRKYDCLISTMIIESGIDIPSVNTIFVNRADTLGLGQLYQIRGRVGRSNERAYAYLLIPKEKQLTKKSRRRLHAIEEFSDLGSGFNIAMRDMEIRGAGNLIGSQQHGFITAVGFDLYCRLLDEAMRELRGEQREDITEPDIKIAVSAFVPDQYISDPDQKMEFYQQCANAQRVVDLLQIREEIEDRFGKMPRHAVALMHVMEIRVISRQLGIEQLQLDGERLSFSFSNKQEFNPKDIEKIVAQSPVELDFELLETLHIRAKIKGRDELECLEKTKSLLEAIG